MRSRFFALTFTLSLAACGGTVHPEATDGATSDAASDATSDSPSGDAACITPVEGTSCTSASVACPMVGDPCCIGYVWTCGGPGSGGASVWTKSGLGCACLADASTPDTSTPDAPVDAEVRCFDDAGAMSSVPYKQCHSDAECGYYTHQTNCCGDTTFVGIASSYQAAMTTCESTWDAHFPKCGCPEGLPKTEDGKTVAFGATPLVKCIDFTSGGGICQTSAP